MKLTGATRVTAADPKAVERDTAMNFSNLLGVKFRQCNTTTTAAAISFPARSPALWSRQVKSGSDAQGKLETGMVVTEVNFQPVSSPDQAIAAAESAKRANKPVLLEVWGRNGEVSFISVRASREGQSALCSRQSEVAGAAGLGE